MIQLRAYIRDRSLITFVDAQTLFIADNDVLCAPIRMVHNKLVGEHWEESGGKKVTQAAHCCAHLINPLLNTLISFSRVVQLKCMETHAHNWSPKLYVVYAGRYEPKSENKISDIDYTIL